MSKITNNIYQKLVEIKVRIFQNNNPARALAIYMLVTNT